MGRKPVRGYSVVTRLFCIAILAVACVRATAAPLSPADRDTIQQQQQQLLEQNQRQRDELERSTPLPRPTAPVVPPTTEGPCFTISRIEISGNTKLSPRDADNVTAPWLNQCLDMTRLTQVTNAVSDWYISRGYITSRAFLTEQDLSSGVLHLTVLEGRLQQIRLEGVPQQTLSMTFPGLEGKILNLRDIEQGMEQLNRVRQVPVEIEIQPGESQGWSIVNLTAAPEFPLNGSLSFDNRGQKSTGTGQFSGALTGNNLLGLADKWFVSGGRSSDFSNSHDAQNFAAGVSVPYGYGLLDYSYSWSNYLNTIDNNGWPWRSTGDSETHRLTGSWVVFRNGDIKTGLTTGITHRISRNYLDDALLESSSRKLSSEMLGINHTQKMFGGVATLNPSFTACFGGDDKACSAARQDALEKQVTYQSLGYQNQKETQAGYQQIQQLLNGISEEAKQTQALYNGMVAAYVRNGMSEDAAKSAVGYQLGAMYIA